MRDRIAFPSEGYFQRLTPYASDASMFVVILNINENGNKVYQCPECLYVTGTAATKVILRNYPYYFTHRRECINTFNRPVEPPPVKHMRQGPFVLKCKC